MREMATGKTQTEGKGVEQTDACPSPQTEDPKIADRATKVAKQSSLSQKSQNTQY